MADNDFQSAGPLFIIQWSFYCRLVVKHQFGANISNYERAYGNENHNHIICTICGDV